MLLKNIKKTTILNQIKIICKSKKGSKDFYTILFNRNTKDDITYHSFWEEALGITIDKDIWKQIFRVCFKAIKDNDLIWMQYRVLYRILGTKELLFKIKSHDDGKCSFCKEYSETILYLFVQCKVVRKFWSELITYFQLILGTDLAIKPSTIILGNLLIKTNVIPFNTLYLADKLYIFRVSKSNQILNYPSFYSFFFYLEQEYTVKLEFKEGNFSKIWGNFMQIFLANSFVYVCLI